MDVRHYQRRKFYEWSYRLNGHSILNSWDGYTLSDIEDRDHIIPNVLLTGRHSLPGKRWKHSRHSQTLAGQLWKHFQEYYLPNPQTEQRGWRRKWRSQKTTPKITNNRFERRTKCGQMHIWINSYMLYFHTREIRGGCYNAMLKYGRFAGLEDTPIMGINWSSICHRMSHRMT